jgi:hypothetical protein
MFDCVAVCVLKPFATVINAKACSRSRSITISYIVDKF